MLIVKQNCVMSVNHSVMKKAIATLLCLTMMGIAYLAVVKKVETSLSPIISSSFPHKLSDNSLLRAEEKEEEFSASLDNDIDSSKSVEDELNLSLSKAANSDKTVIITTLNGPWAQNNSMVDLFLESFHVGNGTEPLLGNLLIVAVDEKALNRCREIHPHCYRMRTEGVDFSGEKTYMTQDYLKMMWRRLLFFGEVLERGYSLVFSDADIMWFRDPFTKFSITADIQIASDKYRGKPEDLQNSPNGGFMYVRSNKNTIRFFKFWYLSKQAYPGKNEQDVLDILKFTEFKRRGLKVRFLDTKHFGGFCQKSQDLNLVCTIHANCCKRGLKAKLIDLRTTLSDWKKYKQQKQSGQREDIYWTPLKACSGSGALSFSLTAASIFLIFLVVYSSWRLVNKT